MVYLPIIMVRLVDVFPVGVPVYHLTTERNTLYLTSAIALGVPPPPQHAILRALDAVTHRWHDTVTRSKSRSKLFPNAPRRPSMDNLSAYGSSSPPRRYMHDTTDKTLLLTNQIGESVSLAQIYVLAALFFTPSAAAPLPKNYYCSMWSTSVA